MTDEFGSPQEAAMHVRRADSRWQAAVHGFDPYPDRLRRLAEAAEAERKALLFADLCNVNGSLSLARGPGSRQSSTPGTGSARRNYGPSSIMPSTSSGSPSRATASPSWPRSLVRFRPRRLRSPTHSSKPTRSAGPADSSVYAPSARSTRGAASAALGRALSDEQGRVSSSMRHLLPPPADRRRRVAKERGKALVGSRRS